MKYQQQETLKTNQEKLFRTIGLMAWKVFEIYYLNIALRIDIVTGWRTPLDGWPNPPYESNCYAGQMYMQRVVVDIVLVSSSSPINKALTSEMLRFRSEKCHSIRLNSQNKNNSRIKEQKKKENNNRADIVTIRKVSSASPLLPLINVKLLDCLLLLMLSCLPSRYVYRSASIHCFSLMSTIFELDFYRWFLSSMFCRNAIDSFTFLSRFRIDVFVCVCVFSSFAYTTTFSIGTDKTGQNWDIQFNANYSILILEIFYNDAE